MVSTAVALNVSGLEVSRSPKVEEEGDDMAYRVNDALLAKIAHLRQVAKGMPHVPFQDADFFRLSSFESMPKVGDLYVRVYKQDGRIPVGYMICYVASFFQEDRQTFIRPEVIASGGDQALIGQIQNRRVLPRTVFGGHKYRRISALCLYRLIDEAGQGAKQAEAPEPAPEVPASEPAEEVSDESLWTGSPMEKALGDIGEKIAAVGQLLADGGEWDVISAKRTRSRLDAIQRQQCRTNQLLEALLTVWGGAVPDPTREFEAHSSTPAKIAAEMNGADNA